MKEQLSLFVTLVTFGLKCVFCSDRNDLWYICPTDTGDCEDYDCDLTQANQRAGYTCPEFPWWSGGFGESEWTDEEETYTCETKLYEPNSTVPFACQHWDIFEKDVGVVELGECDCQEADSGNNYCQSWVCWAFEGSSSDINFNDLGWTTDCDYSSKNNDITVYCPSDDSSFDRDLTYEGLFCECSTSSSNDLYCSRWLCVQYDIKYNNMNNEYVYNIDENEIYECKKAHSSGKFCQEWDGDINSDEAFELARCYCTDPSPEEEYCIVWKCDEKGIYKLTNTSGFITGLLISAFGSVILLSFPLIFKQQCSPKNRRCVFCTTFITFGAFGCVSLMVGGVAAFIIWFVIWLGAFQFFWIYRPTKNCLAYDEICGCTLFGLLAPQEEIDRKKSGVATPGDTNGYTPGDTNEPGATTINTNNINTNTNDIGQSRPMHPVAQQSNSIPAQHYSPQQYPQQSSPQQYPYGQQPMSPYGQQPYAPQQQQQYNEAGMQRPSVPMQDIAIAPQSAPQAYGSSMDGMQSNTGRSANGNPYYG